jgi:pyridoxine/pyridoxamine 5'-phosphate oxidase
MSRYRLGVLGSIAEDLTPQSALVSFAVAPQLEIIFDTVKSSRKYRNLSSRPACSFALGWDGEQTIQYQGQAEELVGTRLDDLQQIYFRARPDGPARLAWPGIVYFAIRPTWIRYSNYDQNPPFIREFQF